MMTVLHVLADVLLAAIVIIYDRRIAELEQTDEELARRVERLTRKVYG